MFTFVWGILGRPSSPVDSFNWVETHPSTGPMVHMWQTDPHETGSEKGSNRFSASRGFSDMCQMSVLLDMLFLWVFIFVVFYIYIYIYMHIYIYIYIYITPFYMSLDFIGMSEYVLYSLLASRPL